jgi:DNA-binding IclR family transcriptional regulator
METRGGRIVKATDNACGVLLALRQLGDAGVTELANELDYSQSAVHAQLNTLIENGLVSKEENRYRLSLQFLNLARGVMSQFGDIDNIRSEVNSLAENTDEVAQFATNEGGRVVYLHKAQGDNAVKTGSFMGKREPIHSTAMGKAILSTKSKEDVKEIIGRHGLTKQTENTVTNCRELYDELDQIRESGHAIDDEENVRGLRCVAAPVIVSEGESLGAVSVTGPASRMTDDRFQSQIIDAIKSSANLIEINYKFS